MSSGEQRKGEENKLRTGGKQNKEERRGKEMSEDESKGRRGEGGEERKGEENTVRREKERKMRSGEDNKMLGEALILMHKYINPSLSWTHQSSNCPL